jgi:aerobic carbon-monoxide dehydrogenase medium subunit
LLIGIELPSARKSSVHFFHEFARRHGDYAIAGLAAQAVVEAGVLKNFRPVFFAIGDRPVLSRAVDRLVEVPVTPKLLSEASAALGEELAPYDDQQATASMRRHLAKVLLIRCLSTLLGRADLDASGRAA